MNERPTLRGDTIDRARIVAAYERTVANWLTNRVGFNFQRRVEQWRSGGDDLEHPIPWLSIACKNQASTSLGSWIDQTVESAGPRIGIVIHHRRGNGDPKRDLVTMELGDFAALLEAIEYSGEAPSEVERTP